MTMPTYTSKKTLSEQCYFNVRTDFQKKCYFQQITRAESLWGCRHINTFSNQFFTSL